MHHGGASSGLVVSVAPSSAANHRVAFLQSLSNSAPLLSDKHPCCSLPSAAEIKVTSIRLYKFMSRPSGCHVHRYRYKQNSEKLQKEIEICGRLLMYSPADS